MSIRTITMYLWTVTCNWLLQSLLRPFLRNSLICSQPLFKYNRSSSLYGRGHLIFNPNHQISNYEPTEIQCRNKQVKTLYPFVHIGANKWSVQNSINPDFFDDIRYSCANFLQCKNYMILKIFVQIGQLHSTIAQLNAHRHPIFLLLLSFAMLVDT